MSDNGFLEWLLVAISTAVIATALIVLYFPRFLAYDPVSSEEEDHKSAVSHSVPVKKSKVPKQTVHRHPLDLTSLKGHGDAVTGIAFSSDGRELATACSDRVVRIFQLDDILARSFRFLRINIPVGKIPVSVAFASSSTQPSLAVAAVDASMGVSLALYAPQAAPKKEQGKLPGWDLKWEQTDIHGKKAILTLGSAGLVDGEGLVISSVLATCSEGTDIKLWSSVDGKCVGTVDTNQLKNTMAAISPNGRFLAAAAFTADVKIWEMKYAKSGALTEVVKVMQLNGHKSAVTWLSFTSDSRGIVTASKDGTLKVWNIDVRYQVNEDTKCLRTFPVSDIRGSSLEASHKLKKVPAHYDMIAVSPDGKVLAASAVRTILWQSLETGEVLDMAENAHDDKITVLLWGPKRISVGDGSEYILASSSLDKKVKIWIDPRREKTT